MAFITREEIIKIARMSHIELTECEMEKMQSHVEAVLAYAARVQDIAKDVDAPVLKNSNIERDDIAIACNPELILAQAPEREGDYFVVPSIIETTE